MAIGVGTFKQYVGDRTQQGRVVLANEALVGGEQSAFGRLISVLSGARQRENKAIYQAFRGALNSAYSEPLVSDVLSKCHPEQKLHLNSAKMREILEALDARTWAETLHQAEIKNTEVCFTDQALVGPMKMLGKGGFNTVYSAEYKHPGGDTFSGVFKAESPSGLTSSVAQESGIKLSAPRVGARNVATYQLNRLLGLEVIPETCFASHEGESGIVMALAEGVEPTVLRDKRKVGRTEPNAELAYYDCLKSTGSALDRKLKDYAGCLGFKALRWDAKESALYAQEWASVDFNSSDPALRRGLNDLQWLDALCAQGDRHSRNYLVKLDLAGRVVHVSGIDNDLSFGANIRDPNAIGSVSNRQFHGFHGCLLPEVIRRATADAFLWLTPETVRIALAGLLTPGEIDACVSRLAFIQEAIVQLEKDGKVLDDSEWSGDKVKSFVEDVNKSYLARDSKIRRARIVQYEEVVKQT